MELDELKNAWQELSARNSELTAQVSEIQTELKLNKTRSHLRRSAWEPAFEVIVGLVAPMLVGNFLVEGPHEARFVIPALVLMVTSIVYLAISIWQLAAIGQIDYTLPVLEVQKKISAIHLVKLRSTQWTLILAPALWMPLFTVAFRGILGIDVYRAFGTLYVMSNLAFGLLVAPVIYFTARAIGNRFRGSSGLQALVDSLGGESLARARRSLDETVRYGQTQ